MLRRLAVLAGTLSLYAGSAAALDITVSDYDTLDKGLLQTSYDGTFDGQQVGGLLRSEVWYNDATSLYTYAFHVDSATNDNLVFDTVYSLLGRGVDLGGSASAGWSYSRSHAIMGGIAGSGADDFWVDFSDDGNLVWSSAIPPLGWWDGFEDNMASNKEQIFFYQSFNPWVADEYALRSAGGKNGYALGLAAGELPPPGEADAPEPSTLLLMGSSLLVLPWLRRRKAAK